MSHPLFGPEVRIMLAENDSGSMKTFCETLHPATIAETLADDEIAVEDVWRILEKTAIKDQAAVIEYFPIEFQVKLVQGTGRPHVAKLIEQMSHDDRVTLLRRLPPRVADELIRLVDEADRKDIKTLFSFEENTVGALMTTDYAWIPAKLTAGEAIDRLRLLAPNSETIYYIYVLDEGTRKLLGVVTLRNLILAPRQEPVQKFMKSDVVTLKVTDEREAAAQQLARYDLLALPVTDDQGRLVGIITHDDVIDVVVEEATEDAHRMGGVSPLEVGYMETDFVTLWRKRAFWLSCLFVAELLTFWAMEAFEEQIARLVVLTLFLPLLLSTGGNSGSQAATLITRALALGQLSPKNWIKVLRSELAMGVVLGITLGLIGFARGASTPEAARGGNKKYEHESLVVRVPTNVAVSQNGDVVTLPPGVEEIKTIERAKHVYMPPGRPAEITERAGFREYTFPIGAEARETPVDRTRLGLVIGLSVAGICLWGTLVGSMLPLGFRSFGIDPGIASSPFVATFVDVTGIVIYFSIAKAFLL